MLEFRAESQARLHQQAFGVEGKTRPWQTNPSETTLNEGVCSSPRGCWEEKEPILRLVVLRRKRALPEYLELADVDKTATHQLCCEAH